MRYLVFLAVMAMSAPALAQQTETCFGTLETDSSGPTIVDLLAPPPPPAISDPPEGFEGFTTAQLQQVGKALFLAMSGPESDRRRFFKRLFPDVLPNAEDRILAQHFSPVSRSGQIWRRALWNEADRGQCPVLETSCEGVILWARGKGCAFIPIPVEEEARSMTLRFLQGMTGRALFGWAK